LFLTRMPGAAAAALAVSLFDERSDLPGVNGEKQAVGDFAANWCELTGQTSSTLASLRMYRLGKLLAPTGVQGHARMAGHYDVEIVALWLRDFRDEVQPHAPLTDWRTIAEQRIRAMQFTLWEVDGDVASLAGSSNAVAGVSRIGPVYTPPNRRSRGYGGAVTAAATGAAIDAGAGHVVLYTDLSNPTSNGIYQAIGYVPDHDGEERRFTPSRPAADARCHEAKPGNAAVPAPPGTKNRAVEPRPPTAHFRAGSR
jgi:predicted GNAT family acetyltransferase